MPDDDWNSEDALPESRMPPARVRVRAATVNLAPPRPAQPPGQPQASEYEVGYRRPPRAHQFQPGRSGNPKGRPKGARSILSILSDELDKPISAQIRGRTVTMSRREALAQRIIEQALKGDHRTVAMLVKVEGAAAPAEDQASPANQSLSPSEYALLQAYLAKLAAEGA